MLRTLAISGYRSLRELVIPLGPLTVVTGPNGSGKSNLYRALRLLQETALGGAVASLAREGGLSSVLWAGPEQFGPSVRRGEHPVQGTVRKKPVAMRVGFAGDDFSYSVEFGRPVPGETAFDADPQIKREAIWTGEVYRPGAVLVDRGGALVRARGDTGSWENVAEQLAPFDTMLTEIADPRRAPAALLMRDRLRSWRFYDGFRSDADAPARQAQIGTLTPVLSNDGRDLAAALATIRAIGDGRALDHAVTDAFPGASVDVGSDGGRLGLDFSQHGLLRPLSQAELSDGTLRYLLWIAALLTPRPPSLMVLNEPETSLHPDLLPALGRLIASASARCQIWVITHSPLIKSELERAPTCRSLALEKHLGETTLVGQTVTTAPAWSWPRR
jgi:predicted ATPase